MAGFQVADSIGIPRKGSADIAAKTIGHINEAVRLLRKQGTAVALFYAKKENKEALAPSKRFSNKKVEHLAGV